MRMNPSWITPNKHWIASFARAWMYSLLAIRSFVATQPSPTRPWLEPMLASKPSRTPGQSSMLRAQVYVRLLVLIVLVGVSSPRMFAQGVNGDSSAVLSPGDVLRIIVWRQTEFSGDFVIGSDGSITHPLYKEVKVAGLPIAVVEQRV